RARDLSRGGVGPRRQRVGLGECGARGRVAAGGAAPRGGDPADATGGDGVSNSGRFGWFRGAHGLRRLRSLLAVAALGCGLVSAIGCTANPPAPRAKPAPKPQGDELLARGDYEAAKAAYEREARLATSAERAARARFLRAM